MVISSSSSRNPEDVKLRLEAVSKAKTLGVVELDWENMKQAPVYQTNFEAVNSDEVPHWWFSNVWQFEMVLDAGSPPDHLAAARGEAQLVKSSNSAISVQFVRETSIIYQAHQLDVNVASMRALASTREWGASRHPGSRVRFPYGSLDWTGRVGAAESAFPEDWFQKVAYLTCWLRPCQMTFQGTTKRHALVAHGALPSTTVPCESYTTRSEESKSKVGIPILLPLKKKPEMKRSRTRNHGSAGARSCASSEGVGSWEQPTALVLFERPTRSTRNVRGARTELESV